MRDRVRSPIGKLPLVAVPLLALLALAPATFAAPAHSPANAPPAHAAAQQPPMSPSQGAQIVAVVNGDVVSMADLVNRRRLFAMSTGLPLTPEVLNRLTDQIVQQLIDEKLRLQEMQRRQIVVPEKEIAEAIDDIEKRNGMSPGAMRQRLAAAGINMRTMIDQVRVQLGWGMVLRAVMGAQAQVSETDVDELERTLRAEKGQTEFNIAEIFVPIANPSQSAEAERFSDTIIQRLRAGAPFAVVAAQFSQSQTALRGGERGWIQANQVSDDELRVLKEMPVGAVSNPIKVPGGLSIVTLHGRREIGNENVLMASVRQIFFPFSAKLNPTAPTAQQRQMLDAASKLGSLSGGCDAMDAAADKVPGAKKLNPGEIPIASINTPVLRQMVATLPVGKASQPLIADDGVAVVMVCARDTKAQDVPPKKQLIGRILNQRIELTSRQLMRNLQRRAVIDMRS
jgi:peptidyl-prolyl cis-trans isomerase SurA